MENKKESKVEKKIVSVVAFRKVHLFFSAAAKRAAARATARNARTRLFVKIVSALWFFPYIIAT